MSGTELATWLGDLAVWDADLNLDDNVACVRRECDAPAAWRVGCTCTAHGRLTFHLCPGHAERLRQDLAAAAGSYFVTYSHENCKQIHPPFTWGRL